MPGSRTATLTIVLWRGLKAARALAARPRMAPPSSPARALPRSSCISARAWAYDKERTSLATAPSRMYVRSPAADGPSAPRAPAPIRQSPLFPSMPVLRTTGASATQMPLGRRQPGNHGLRQRWRGRRMYAAAGLKWWKIGLMHGSARRSAYSGCRGSHLGTLKRHAVWAQSEGDSLSKTPTEYRSIRGKNCGRPLRSCSPGPRRREKSCRLRVPP